MCCARWTNLAVVPGAAILSVLEIVEPGAVSVLVIGDEMANGILPGVIQGAGGGSPGASCSR